jgi:hypothetical protein
MPSRLTSSHQPRRARLRGDPRHELRDDQTGEEERREEVAADLRRDFERGGRLVGERAARVRELGEVGEHDEDAAADQRGLCPATAGIRRGSAMVGN